MEADIRVVRLMRKIIRDQDEMQIMDQIGQNDYFATDYFDVMKVEKKEVSSSLTSIMGIWPDAMEYNHMAEDCLCQILIKNPQKIALQMLENGMNDSWLYPEMPVVSSEIENHRVL